jgi:DNA polymerase-3 subunit epsilon
MILFFDTETTGFPDYNMPSAWEGQPHLVQLAALLTEDDGTERASFNIIVEPDGYKIPDGAAKVHGISTEIAMRCGVPLSAAIWPFICLRSQASVIVAHNVKFDIAVMETAIARGPKRDYHPGPKDSYCTMEHAAEIVALPPTEKMKATGLGHKPKAPKLEEAYKHFFGTAPAEQHTALADVRSCMAIYRKLKEIHA